MPCNSIPADHSGMAPSRFLAAAAACVVLVSFAAEKLQIVLEWLREGWGSDLSADLFPFWRWAFSLQTFFKKCFKIAVFPLGRRDPVLELQFQLLCWFKVSLSKSWLCVKACVRVCETFSV